MRLNFGNLVVGDIKKEYFQLIFKNWALEGENVEESENKFAEKISDRTLRDYE